MDIKLKKFSDNMAVRVLAFLLCATFFTAMVAGTTLMVLSIQRLDYNGGLEGIFEETSYEKSADLQYEFSDKQEAVMGLLTGYKSRENIMAGNTIDESFMNEVISELFYNGEYNYNGDVIIANYYKGIAENSGTEGKWAGELSQAEGAGEEGDIRDFGDPAVRTAFVAANEEQINQIRKNMIKDDLRAFEKDKQGLDGIKGFTYYATDGENILTNMKLNPGQTPAAKDFEKQPAYLTYENDDLEKEPRSAGGSQFAVDISREMENRLDGYYNDNLKLYFSFDQSFMAARQGDYNVAREEMAKWIPLIGAALLLTLAMFLWLAVTTGGKKPGGTRRSYKLDKVWTEIQLAGIGLTMFFGAWLCNANYYNNCDGEAYYYTMGGVSDGPTAITTGTAVMQPFEVALYAAGTFILASLGLWFILSCIRLLKDRRFIKNAVVYKIIEVLWKSLKNIYNGGSVMHKVVILTLGVCLISATVFLAPVVFVAILVFAPKWVNKYDAIKDGVREVKNGNLSHKIPVTGDGELDILAKDINDISDASSIAIQNELKNQRLKSELISNVSHDLKTPLTSMVTYIDLLKTEGLQSDRAPEYLAVLDQKTNRLRQLTEDLFEAAKASSGAMPVRMERVEMLSLINQGLGEMDQRIEESGLEFIINAEKEKYYVWADGQLLWRVVENLLGNVLKYAQENTRVYINLTELRGNGGKASTLVVLEIKNISKQALNINAEELMERFKRGDESRTTEGSGLGLTIAKDLVKLQNGWFDIVIDGDLFKAQVILDKAQEEKSK